jgi:hypothetical protein
MVRLHDSPPDSHEAPAPVVPLDYAPPRKISLPNGPWVLLVANIIRRLFVGTGVGLVVGGILVLNIPYQDEAAISIATGLGLIIAALPLPRWFRSEL